MRTLESAIITANVITANDRTWWLQQSTPLAKRFNLATRPVSFFVIAIAPAFPIELTIALTL